MAATCVIQPIDMVKVRFVLFASGNDTTLLAIVLICLEMDLLLRDVAVLLYVISAAPSENS